MKEKFLLLNTFWSFIGDCKCSLVQLYKNCKCSWFLQERTWCQKMTLKMAIKNNNTKTKMSANNTAGTKIICLQLFQAVGKKWGISCYKSKKRTLNFEQPKNRSNENYYFSALIRKLFFQQKNIRFSRSFFIEKYMLSVFNLVFYWDLENLNKTTENK